VRAILFAGFGLALVVGCSASSTGHRTGDSNGASGGSSGAPDMGSAGTGGASGSGGGAGMAGTATAGSGGAGGRGSGGSDAGAVAAAGGRTVGVHRDGGMPFRPDIIPNTPGLQLSPKLDLLLVVDNSISMADKEAVLAKSIPDLVARIVSSTSGVTDLHVGVITSSIGGHGSTLCQGSDQGDLSAQEQNDHGWLVGTRPRFPTSMANALQPTPEGFLEWTPRVDVTQLRNGIQEMVVAAGEFGCGLESQLEAMYRFLVDPHPYQQIVVQNCNGTTTPCAVQTGLDQKLLAQRQAFLRPDSVVAVVELTDENDCSIREDGQYYYAARSDIILPHATAACDANPNDPCCYSCSAATPAGCTADPSCSVAATASKDQPNLRCFHEKQRFGLDFLYPTARYVNALSRTELCTSRPDLLPAMDCPDTDGDGKPDLVHNQLFWSQPTGDAAAAIVRDPSIVYLMGIIGVPYQDLEATESATRIDFRTPTQLVSAGAWGAILGDATPPGGGPPVLPTDTLLVESIDPRTGVDGQTPPAPLASPSAGYQANPVNGHEWVNTAGDDLQYSCIFPIPMARDCDMLAQQSPQPGCDCKPGTASDENPLCQTTTGTYSTLQLFAKAYPPLRELEVIQGLGANGLTASICARNLTDDSRQDYAYRPATDLLLNQIRRSAP